MEDKKRKRPEDDGGDSTTDHPSASKKAKHDLLFPAHASHLDSEARALYISSPAAQEVLAAIARGDPTAITAGHAPPGLSKSQRSKWGRSLRGVLQKASGSGQAVSQAGSANVEYSTAGPHSAISGDVSKKRKRAESVTAISKPQVIDLFFAGAACLLDESVRKTFLASGEAKFVTDAVLEGDADAITAGHAPPGLDRKQRVKWRQEHRLLAQRQRDVMLSKPGTTTDGPGHPATPTSMDHLSTEEQAHLGAASGEMRNTSNASLEGTPRPSNPKARLAGFTQLAQPPTKIWHKPEENKPSDATSIKVESLTPAHSSHPSQNAISNDHQAARISLKDDHVASVSEASISSFRHGSHASNPTLNRVRSRESTSNVIPRRIPGNRNFEAPDYFADGSLADTQRRFEAWARAQRGGSSDSSDSDSSEDSDEESNGDASSSGRPAVRGSFHESWAEQITNPEKQPAATTSEAAEQVADENALDSSDSNDDDDAEVQSQIQSQVSRELQEATSAPGDNANEDDQESPAESEPDAVHVLDSQAADDLSASDVSPVSAHEAAAGGTVIPSSLDDQKVRPSTPDQQAPGTPTPYGQPNTIRQANVRVKRMLSKTDPGGDRSGYGPIEAVKPANKPNLVTSGRRTVGSTTHGDRLDHGELSDDVYEAIDDVTSGLMSSASLGDLRSMNECKPDSHNGSDGSPLLTNTGSAIKTSDMGGREDMMENATEVDVDGNVLGASDEGEKLAAPLKPEDGKDGQKAATQPRRSHSRTISSSLSSALSELSHTPSLPAEPQVIIPVYVPETPEMKHEESVKKKRKMTGNSSQHFSSAKRAKSSGKSKQTLDEITMETPEGQAARGQDGSSSIYQTAVSRMTRSAFKDARLPEPERIDTSQDEVSSPLPHATQALSAGVEESSPLPDVDADTPGLGEHLSAAIDQNIEVVATDEDKTNLGETITTDLQTSPFATPPQHPSTPNPNPTTTTLKKTPRPKTKSTGRISTHFITDRVDLPAPSSTPSKAGLSRVPIPPTTHTHFGLIQEKLYQEPFWLLIAVTFLNKTAGRSAVPIFWKLKERYGTPEALAGAEQEELLGMVHKLGLQNQRSKRLISIAKAWVERPPEMGRRYRTLNYPNQGDGRARDVPNIVEEDAEDCAGALEIGHIPGCGAYAWDSWRIFCRDTLRGLDANNTTKKTPDFEAEWKRVLPKDKELRACLRWMWVKEGWIWDPLTGERRRATHDEVEKAERGEMEIWDGQEAEFARRAAEGEGTGTSGTPTKAAGDAEGLQGPPSSSSKGSSTIHLTPRRPPTRVAKAAHSIEQADEEEPPTKKPPTKTMKKTPTTTSSKRKPKTKTRTSSPPAAAAAADEEFKQDDEVRQDEETPLTKPQPKPSENPPTQTQTPSSNRKRKTRTSSFLPDDNEGYGEDKDEDEGKGGKRRSRRRITT
ncbi:hypothetical protein M409DRAFT_23195 [Zasmidium cellare ATCC 36951]|uniref:HhH-GPD domain-containing protein n=1 Tax=Zasmidium cellare ATCC 36951 TaxID=1080233 RepID=A0A6A6CK77_ZASCE|nr:uncharacterized protein M409DRAFT_23195 [Zasmidium cellare ATCC 36951]KAF2166560.1 hypothetical protein M409DRAFT_23195 [Zasmidium cellare ATCC 36951]